MLRAKWGHEKIHFFHQCDEIECGAYLQYKKTQKDKAAPKDLPGQQQCCVEWITRPYLTASPYQSDKEDNDAADAVWRDCLRWLPQDCYLRTLWRGMELKGVLTRMGVNMDGENIYKCWMHNH